MAGTRRYLWTQRVKYPNREDMRSKVSSRNWRKVYSAVRGSPEDSWTMSLTQGHAKLLKISLDRLTTKGTSQRGYAFSKTKNFETSGKTNQTYKLTAFKSVVQFLTNIYHDNRNNKLKVLEGHDKTTGNCFCRKLL